MGPRMVEASGRQPGVICMRIEVSLIFLGDISD
jgi:hypothetical protein